MRIINTNVAGISRVISLTLGLPSMYEERSPICVTSDNEYNVELSKENSHFYSEFVILLYLPKSFFFIFTKIHGRLTVDSWMYFEVLVICYNTVNVSALPETCITCLRHYQYRSGIAKQYDLFTTSTQTLPQDVSLDY